jgi:hypothetical protein
MAKNSYLWIRIPRSCKRWVFNGRSWTEAYLLRSFLQFNNTFDIELFPNYLIRFHEDFFQRNMPLCLKSPGGSIWLLKKQ